MAQMGIGVLGSPNIIIQRKFRFLVEWNTPAGLVPRHFVKIASKPHLEVDETEINFLNGNMSIPGKGKWQPLNMTYISVASFAQKPLYDWIARVYDYTQADGLNHIPQSEKAGYAATGVITMLDGCGTELEQWILFDAWPQSVNFGDLDMGSSDEVTIDMTIKYRYARMIGLGCMPTPTGACIGC